MTNVWYWKRALLLRLMSYKCVLLTEIIKNCYTENRNTRSSESITYFWDIYTLLWVSETAIAPSPHCQYVCGRTVWFFPLLVFRYLIKRTRFNKSEKCNTSSSIVEIAYEIRFQHICRLRSRIISVKYSHTTGDYRCINIWRWEIELSFFFFTIL